MSTPGTPSACLEKPYSFILVLRHDARIESISSATDTLEEFLVRLLADVKSLYGVELIRAAGPGDETRPT